MSAELAIREVGDRRGMGRLLDLPMALYRGRPNWVPPLRRAQAKVLARKTAFFDHADMALFLAERAGRAVGRIAAIHNRAHNECHKDRVGFFGFFECDIHDAAAAEGLFDHARRWLADRGLTSVRGPVNPSMNAECGLLIDGFDRPPMVMMPYNPPEYAGLIEAAGFVKCKDLYAYLIRAADVDEGRGRNRMLRLAEVMRRRHPEVRIRPINMKRYEREVLDLVEIFETARSDNWGHVKLTAREVLEMARDMKAVVDPDLILVGQVGDDPAGASMALPNINRALAACRGRLLPLGFLKFMREMKRIHEIRIFGIAVLERYRHLGITAMLLLETILRGRAKGIDIGEASWVLEDNEMSNRTIQNVLSPEHYKTYRIYEKPISPPGGASGQQRDGFRPRQS
jgi:GNAT superfamily N-acetyltransferase